MIGLYDSGLGGLTVLAALRAAGIDDDVLYFADGAHVPYGDRTDAEIASYHRSNFALLAERGIDALVMGCNSSCAVASRVGWPQAPFPVLDLIDAAAGAFRGAGHAAVAVIATPTTVRSGAYTAAIRAAAPGVRVVEIAAPALVPLVEAGAADTPAARDAVRSVVAQVPPDTDAVLYGCTHYPLLDRWFADALPQRVTRLDPAQAQAQATAALLGVRGVKGGAAQTTFLTTADAAAFTAGIRRWTGDASAVAESVAALTR